MQRANAPTERRGLKVDISIHQTKAASYKRHATISKSSCLTKSGNEHLLFLGVGFQPATEGSREFCAPTEIRLVKVDTYIHGTKATTYKRRNHFKIRLFDQTWNHTPIVCSSGNRTSQRGWQRNLCYNGKSVVKVSIYIHRTKAARQTL